MHLIAIDDPSDPRLDDYRDLTDTDVRPDRRGIVIAEGVNVVARLAGSPYAVRSVVGVQGRLDSLAGDLAGRDVPGYVLDKWALSELVGFRVTRGVLAAATRPAPLDAAALLAGASRIAVLEGLNDFENVGSLFRNAAAFGVQAVLLDPTCADPLYRRSVRVSMGHVLRVPFAVLADWPAGLGAVHGAGLTLIAMTPGGAQDLRALARPGRWAVLLGAEGPGLSAAALDAADVHAQIPMAPGVDSLNVATSGAVAFAFLR